MVDDEGRIVMRLEQARAYRGISVAELARRVGVDRKRLWRVLNGERAMRVDEFVRLCVFFGMGIGAFATADLMREKRTGGIAEEPESRRTPHQSKRPVPCTQHPEQLLAALSSAREAGAGPVPRAYPRRGQTAPAGGGGAPPRLRSATLRAGDPPRPCGGSAASRPRPKEASRRLERRPKQMHLRMSERELAAAKALAGELDMTVSDLVRVLLQLPADSVGTGARLVVVDRTTAAKLSREMTRWGHHYNQAVHALNAIAYYLRANDMDAPDVLEELARAERKLDEMRPAVDSLRREVAELSGKALAALWR